jgi:hypothetical protein
MANQWEMWIMETIAAILLRVNLTGVNQNV